MLLQKVVKPLAGDGLHQVAADIGGQGIHPTLARVIAQGHLGQLHGEVVQGFALAAAHLVLGVGLVHGVAIVRGAQGREQGAIGQAAGVAEHMAEGHRRIGSDQLHPVAVAGHPDLMVAPFGNVAADGVVELKIALFVQHHQGHRGDRLGHGIDAEDGVVSHRLVPFPVHLAEGAEVGHVAVTRDGDLAAGNLAGLDVVAVQVGGDPLQPFGGKAGARG